MAFASSLESTDILFPGVSEKGRDLEQDLAALLAPLKSKAGASTMTGRLALAAAATRAYCFG